MKQIWENVLAAAAQYRENFGDQYFDTFDMWSLDGWKPEVIDYYMETFKAARWVDVGPGGISWRINDNGLAALGRR